MLSRRRPSRTDWPVLVRCPLFSPAYPSERPEDLMVRKASGNASWHLAPPAQEVTHAIIDVIVDGPIGHQPRAVAEVVRPAAQQTVQPVAYIRPRGCQKECVSRFL